MKESLIIALTAGLVIMIALSWHLERTVTYQKTYPIAYAHGYQDGIYEGIKRAQAHQKEELPLPISDEPGCDITPERPKVNYLERMRTK